MELLDLSLDTLIIILSYCRIQDILNLKLTCRRLNQIILYSLPNSLFGGLLCTGQGTKNIRDRSHVILSCMEKFRVLKNWRKGRYTEHSHFYDLRQSVATVQLEKEYVWFSREHRVFGYKRRGKTLQRNRAISIYEMSNYADVGKFIKGEKFLAAGANNGKVWVWFLDTANVTAISKEFHKNDINDIDVYDNFILSGGNDGQFGLFNVNREHLKVLLCNYGKVDNRIWSSSFNIMGDRVVLGTSSCKSVAPICIFDSNRLDSPLNIFGTFLDKGSSVLDIKFLTNSVFLTCGHDTYVRKWDLRLGDICVQSYKDPFQSTIYCMDTDYVNTLLTGTQAHGRMVLYDMRSPKYVQLYFLRSCRGKNRNSPIYSLSFDPLQIVAGTDRNLDLVDFSGYETTGKDYSSLYKKEICM
ncbi:F-box/WD repeat-containing protein 4 [Onthophagus taurus]|uniref:F-box/WD repeat-containing protein 4 n=1 Tax=Onthophagus taurus TaxID=166361 RepID=UPI000C200484|nr:F-box/WD repeat-containing protein 4 [Onthophagus taurus]